MEAEFQQHVTMIKVTDDSVAYDKEQALASIKKSQVYGDTKGLTIQCWPSEAELRTKSAETLSKLRFNSVLWFGDTGSPICSIQFTMNDGTVSPKIGTYQACDNSFVFPKDRPIKTISVRAVQGRFVT